MTTAHNASRRWAARLCQVAAWSRELDQQATECDAALEELLPGSAHVELTFAGTRDLLNFAAKQVDQTAEALTMILELLDHLADSPN
jgi:hypothetical protein